MWYAHVCVKQNLGFVYSKFQDGDCELPVFVFFFFFQGKEEDGKDWAYVQNQLNNFMF